MGLSRKQRIGVLYSAEILLIDLIPEKMKSDPVYLEVASLTDPGRVRALNEDAVAVDGESGFAVVADGIGGHRAGDVASRMALESVVERLRGRSRAPSPQRFAEQSIAAANFTVLSAANAKAEFKGMGTTLAMVFMHGQRAVLAHVGDSRIYRLRNGSLELLTRDDTLLHDQLEQGLIGIEDAGDSHNRHMVTQALGINERISVHLHEEDVRRGDIYLLCTDGLNDQVDDKDIETIIETLKTNLPLAAFHLVQLANDNGGYDNITVALMRVLNDAPTEKRPSWLSRLRNWLAI